VEDRNNIDRHKITVQEGSGRVLLSKLETEAFKKAKN
jgi:hypothetical protein